jgi:Tfp pilus assembly protein PilV
MPVKGFEAPRSTAERRAATILSMVRRARSRSGQSIIEAIVAVGVLSTLLAPLLLLSSPASSAGLQAREYTTAAFLARQGFEAVRSIGRASFATLAVSSPTYGIAESGGIYAFSGTSDTPVTGFTRTVTITNGLREGSTDGNLCDISCAGTPSSDTDTKKIVVRVAWSTSGKSRSVSITGYLTNWK